MSLVVVGVLNILIMCSGGRINFLKLSQRVPHFLNKQLRMHYDRVLSRRDMSRLRLDDERRLMITYGEDESAEHTIDDSMDEEEDAPKIDTKGAFPPSANKAPGAPRLARSWTQEEETKLMALVKRLGHGNWTEVSKHFNGFRPDQASAERWR